MNILFNAFIKRMQTCALTFCKPIISILICIALPSHSIAQLSSQFPTPNAAAATMFDQYPQGNYTGVPEIGIPVYDFNYQGLSMPITLMYNNNLVKPNLPAGWVGLGWNLSLGGMINRVVNGKPDDAKWYDVWDWHETHDEQMGLYYNYSSLAGNWADATRIENAIKDLLNYPKYYKFDGSEINTISGYRTIKDYSPDEFSFSVGNISGVFYLDDQRQWKVRSKSKVKVIITDADFQMDYTTSIPALYNSVNGDLIVPMQAVPMHRYINRITLLDDQGIKYVFGGISSATEDVQHPYDTYEKYIKTWHLTSVEFPNGKQIRLEYESGPYIFSERPVGYFAYYDGNTHTSHGDGPLYSGQRSHPAYLTKIITDDVEVDFFRSEQSNHYAQLNNIKVYSRKPYVNIGLLKDFYFTYTNTAHNILKLASFYEKNPITGEAHPYKFGYNQEGFYDVYKNTDHWGFYTVVPLQTSSQALFFASRAADIANCRTEVLNQIIYPTGGHTNYIWEPNQYRKAVPNNSRTDLITYDQDQYAGGVRISQIDNYDDVNHMTGSRQFIYKKNYGLPGFTNASSGVLYATMENSYSSPTRYMIDADAPLAEDNVGSHISYSEVTVKDMDGGYTSTIYSNFDTGLNNEYRDEEAVLNASSFGPGHRRFISNAHERGFPLQEIQYKNGGIPLVEKDYTYIRVNKSIEFVKSYKGEFENGPGSSIWQGSALKKYTNAYLIDSEKEIQHYPAGDVTSITNYTYDPSTLYLKSKITNSSNNDVLQTTYRYVGDMTATGDDPENAYPGMTALNITRPLIETNTFKNSNLVSRVRNNYFKTVFGLYHPKNTQVWTAQNPPEMKMNFQSYDATGNLVSQYPPNGNSTSYQWGYNNQYPVAKVSNAYRKFVVTPQNGTDSKNVSLYLGTTASTSPSAPTTTFVQNVTGDIIIRLPSGMPSTSYSISFGFSLTGPVNKSGSYSCTNGTCNVPADNTVTFANMPPGNYTFSMTGNTTFPSYTFQIGMGITYQALLQPIVPESEFYYEDFEESAVTGVTADQAHTGKKSFNGSFTTSFTLPNTRKYIIQWWSFDNTEWSLNEQLFTQNIALTGKIDDIRIFPADGQIMTYTYDQLVGPTSETDTRGETIFYEYDGFKRLINKKDTKGNIIQNYKYNTYTDLIWNTPKTGSFTKACTTGVGSTVEYVVPAHTYSAYTQEAADALAQADVNANGQVNANANGTCTILPFALVDQASVTTGDGQNYATYYIRLYADNAYTTVFTATSPIVINYRIRTSTSVNNGTPTVVTNDYTATINTGASSVKLGQYENGCGPGGVVNVIAGGEQTNNSSNGTESAKGGATTNLLPPGGGGNTTCITKTVMLLNGTGYIGYIVQ